MKTRATSLGGYKQDYMDYHISNIENFQELLNFLKKNVGINEFISENGLVDIGTYEEFVGLLKESIHSDAIYLNSHGLRAKVAELCQLYRHKKINLPEELTIDSQIPHGEL